MLRKIIAAYLLAAGFAALPVHANEAVIRKAMQSRFPGGTVESVAKTPFAGLFEVVVGGRVLYTDEKASFIFIGSLLDTRGPDERNLTAERTAQLTAATLAKSTANAIKRVHGSGKRTIYTLEDPNCGYCKAFYKELLKVKDVTIYTYLWPILSPDSTEKAKAVWCAKDRAKAWDDLMVRGVVPRNDGKCETPIEKNKELAQRFGARGTPAVYLADGRQLPGMIPADRVEEALSTVSTK
jgi:thiol:disulfide interchange protein DsbC